MGYWSQDAEGNSFAAPPDGTELVWGDAPADILGDALDQIIKTFQSDLGRRPTKVEVRAGIEFTLRAYTDDMEEDDD